MRQRFRNLPRVQTAVVALFRSRGGIRLRSWISLDVSGRAQVVLQMFEHERMGARCYQHSARCSAAPAG